MSKKYASFGVFAVSLLFATLVMATSMEKMSLEQLTQASEQIVVGKIMSQKSKWENGAIQTVVEVSVVDLLKGNISQTVEVVIAGGQTMTSSGVGVSEISAAVPRFFQDTEAVLFLISTENSQQMEIVGYSQGYLPILDEVAGKVVRSPDQISNMPLETLKNRVRATQSN